MKKDILFIYGVPGSGKTYFSQLLGKHWHTPVIEGDKIKDRARTGKNKNENPFLFYGTYQAWKQIGKLNKDNVIKGLMAVRAAMYEAVEEEIENRDDCILKAEFLDPHMVIEYGSTILLTTQNEAKHM